MLSTDNRIKLETFKLAIGHAYVINCNRRFIQNNFKEIERREQFRVGRGGFFCLPNLPTKIRTVYQILSTLLVPQPRSPEFFHVIVLV